MRYPVSVLSTKYSVLRVLPAGLGYTWNFSLESHVSEHDTANTKLPVIQSLERVSRPGLRTYAKPDEFKRVKNGLGVAIVSTSKGVMTDKEARAQNVGGEVLCNIF